jgi:hypothetical protein
MANYKRAPKCAIACIYKIVKETTVSLVKFEAPPPPLPAAAFLELPFAGLLQVRNKVTSE